LEDGISAEIAEKVIRGSGYMLGETHKKFS